MNRLLQVVALSFAIGISIPVAQAQVDEICREFGVFPSLDKPMAQVPYLFGKVQLIGFDATSKPKVTVVFSDRDNPSRRMSLSKTGNFCFKRGGGGGTIAIEVDGIEVARRSIPSFGAAQQREDFDIYPPTSPASSAPGTVSAKFSHPRSEKTEELYQKAAKAERDKQIGVAIAHMKEIVAIDATDFVAWSILGSLYLEQKSFDESDAAFRKSLGLKVEYTPAWVNVGRLRVAQKNFGAAIEIFKHAVTLEPDSAKIYKLLGEAHLQAKQGTLGVEALNQAIKLDPVGMADCHLLIGRLYDLAGAKQLASKEYRLFLTKVPDYSDKQKLEKFIKDNPE